MKNYKLNWALVCTIAFVLSAGQVFAAAPSNDSCANALPITNVTNQAFSTIDSTFDGPGDYITSGNIWYCYTATCTGTVTVSLCGSSYDTKLAVYSNCSCPATSGRRIASNDDKNAVGCDLQSEVTFNAVCGSQYLIEVGGYSGYTGNGVITISCSGTPCSTSPANDNCSSAQAVGNVSNLSFDTTYATFDGPGSCNLKHSPNLWYKYTATCTGTAVVSLCGSSFDTLLAVYSGTSCSNLTSIGCNDDSCNQQSELTINVTANNTYWIAVSGFELTDKGSGVLTISCNGSVQQASDLGDAPDSTNHFSATMRTYDTSIVANFPTVYQGNAPYGPIHFQPKAVAYLGNSVTFEDEADQGYDEDSTNNIIPSAANYNSNKDGGDDSITFPMYMNHCKLTAFDYKVNVIDPNVEMYVNVWVDWNRDGDWADSGKTDSSLICTTCNTGGIVDEWAVHNQLLYGLKKGLNTITTPGFLAWHPSGGDQKVWMRIMLSEEPWKGGSGVAGSGPAGGYQYGETEDYYFEPFENCVACEDLNRDGTVDEYDLLVYMMSWLSDCYN